MILRECILLSFVENSQVGSRCTEQSDLQVKWWNLVAASEVNNNSPPRYVYTYITYIFLMYISALSFNIHQQFQIYPPNKLKINSFKVCLDCVDPAVSKSALKAHWDGQVSSPQEVWPGLFWRVDQGVGHQQWQNTNFEVVRNDTPKNQRLDHPKRGGFDMFDSLFGRVLRNFQTTSDLRSHDS